MASSKTSRIAIGLSIAGFLLVLTAFVSPYWLTHDGELKNPKFLNLGKLN